MSVISVPYEIIVANDSALVFSQDSRAVAYRQVSDSNRSSKSTSNHRDSLAVSLTRRVSVLKDKISASGDEWQESSEEEASDIPWEANPNKRISRKNGEGVKKPTPPKSDSSIRIPKRKAAIAQLQENPFRRRCSVVHDYNGNTFKSERDLNEDRTLGLSMSRNAVDYRQRKDVEEAFQKQFRSMIDPSIVEQVEEEGGITPTGRLWKSGVRMMERVKEERTRSTYHFTGEYVDNEADLTRDYQREPQDLPEEQNSDNIHDQLLQKLLTENSELKAKLDAAHDRISKMKAFVREQ